MNRGGSVGYVLALLSIFPFSAGCGRTVTSLPAASQLEQSEQAGAGALVVPGRPISQRLDRIIAWGDSLTHGDQDGSGIRYPTQLTKLLGTRVLNAGIGGQTSSQIAVRANAYEGEQQQTFAGSFLMPTSGSVTVRFQPGYEPCFYAPNSLVATIYPSQGIPIRFTVGNDTYYGTCTDIGARVYTFTPDSYPQNPVLVPAGTGWSAVLDGRDNACWVIWVGRLDNLSDPGLTVANIAAMVATAKARSGCYLVLGVLNAVSEPAGSIPYNEIVALNQRLGALYGANFLDIRTYLVDAPTSGTPPDVYFRAEDVSPYTLRAQRYSGTLRSSVSSSTCALSFGEKLEAGATVTLDSELILIQSGTDGNYACTRGFVSTEAVAHDAGANWTGVDSLHPGQNSLSAVNGYVVIAQAVAGKLRRVQPVAGGPSGRAR